MAPAICLFAFDCNFPDANSNATNSGGTATSSSSNNLVLILTFVALCLCLVLSCAVLVYVYVRSKRKHTKAQIEAHNDKSSIASILPFFLASSFHSMATQSWWDSPAFRSSSLWLLTSKQSFRTGLDTGSSTPSSEEPRIVSRKNFMVSSLGMSMASRPSSSSSNSTVQSFEMPSLMDIKDSRDLSLPKPQKSRSKNSSLDSIDDTVPGSFLRKDSINSTPEDLDEDLQTLISKHESFIRKGLLKKQKSDRKKRAMSSTRRFSALKLLQDKSLKDFNKLSHPPLAHLR